MIHPQPNNAFIMRLILAVPGQLNGQDGYWMTYDAPDLPPFVDNPQWITAASMEMLLEVSEPEALEVIRAALAAGAAG